MSSEKVEPRSDAAPLDVRLDVWLDVACLYKTRSEAQKACSGGKVEVNGNAGKAHKSVRIGDEIRLTRGNGRRQVVVVRQLADQHIAKAAARELYEDRTPPPRPEELEMMELDRAFRRSFGPAAVRPQDKKQRRQLQRLKDRLKTGSDL